MSISFEFSDTTLERMSGKGVFLTVGEDKPNTMTIGWGSISVYWNKPVFIVPVRHSRYSYSVLEKGSGFTVSVPPQDERMLRALAVCGKNSGRDMDKYAYGWITPVAGVAGKVPIIAGCDYYYECRVIYSADLKLEELPPEIKAKCYPSDDAHKMYFGEILAAYKG